MIAAMRNKRFLVFGGAAALCLLFLAGSVIVHLKRYYALHTQRTVAEQQLAEVKAAVEGIDSAKLAAQNQGLASELSEIERALPEREYMPTLIKQIQSGAVMTGSDLVELRQGEIRRGLRANTGAAPAEGATDAAAPAEGGAPATGEAGAAGDAGAGAAAPPLDSGQGYSEMDIEVRLDGTYIGAFEFIRHLGKLGKIISVENIAIEKSGTREQRPGGGAAATVKLGCKAYILEPRSGFPGQVTLRVL
jgi:Tfp pilus assembly protein PilO